MRKTKKRFVALLVVFTSIISFLPFSFNGKEAKAASYPAEAADTRINVDGKKTPLPVRTDTDTSEEIYTANSIEGAFDITVQDVQKTDSQLIQEALAAKSNVTDVTKQEVVILSINQTKLTNADGTKNAAGYAIIQGMGIKLDPADPPAKVQGDTDRVGVKISGLPAGVNKITYEVKITTKTAIFTPDKDSDGKVIQNSPGTATIDSTSEKTGVAYDKTIAIEHGKDFVIDKISKMLFKAYVGDATAFSDNDTVPQAALNENNKVPFLYSTTAAPDPNFKLRYNFDVPDSLSALKYVMTFGDMINLRDGVVLYKNGVQAVEGKDYSLSGQNLTGNLANLNQSDLIVVKINSVTDSNTSTVNISKCYSIEIKYNKLNADKDYSLTDAGVTKLDYNDDSTVKAYIGKKFEVEKNAAGYSVYTGEIHIDSRARMISLEPALVKGKSNIGYIVTNNYVDSNGQIQEKKSVLKNGKEFIDFLAGSSNELQIDIYAGQNGSVTDSSQILARYKLKVIPITGNEFNMGLTFGTTGAAAVYLTQPGVKENQIDFNSARRTYDLYYGSPNVDNVQVTFTGARSDKNEYIKVFLADSTESSYFKEAQESVNNTTRERSINVKVGTAQKLVVQAYYDDYQKDSTTGQNKLDSNGNPIFISRAIGDQYIFYLPENIKDNGNNPSVNSTNASLSSLKIKGYSLNESFSSDKLNYTATVAKEDKIENLTVISEDQNVKSITATIDGSNQTYDLYSGQATEIELNSSGKTNIKIVVTAQDGTTTKTYNLLIKNNTKGSNTNLKNVILSSGDYTFNSKVDPTKVRVDQKVNSIKITPVVEDPKASATVDGEKYTDTAISVDLKGSQKTNITIVVTSEDGSDSKTYTLEVYRVDIADWDNVTDNGDKYDDDQYYDDYNDCWVDTKKYEEWGTVNGKPAYFDKHNRQVKNAWIKTGEKLYYLNNLGFRASGWKVDDKTGQTYYLDPTTGEMRTGWINLNNTWYYLDPNGIMHKGWLYLNGKWYYFTPNGTMIVNQTMFIDDKTYTLGQDGAVIF